MFSQEIKRSGGQILSGFRNPELRIPTPDLLNSLLIDLTTARAKEPQHGD
jgi:hypothetical protein